MAVVTSMSNTMPVVMISMLGMFRTIGITIGSMRIGHKHGMAYLALVWRSAATREKAVSRDSVIHITKGVLLELASLVQQRLRLLELSERLYRMIMCLSVSPSMELLLVSLCQRVVTLCMSPSSAWNTSIPKHHPIPLQLQSPLHWRSRPSL